MWSVVPVSGAVRDDPESERSTISTRADWWRRTATATEAGRCTGDTDEKLNPPRQSPPRSRIDGGQGSSLTNDRGAVNSPERPDRYYATNALSLAVGHHLTGVPPAPLR